jgi:ribosomal protein L11 methyltransferase
MKYYEVKFTISAPEGLMQDARDLLSAVAGEAGFESFEDTDKGITGYVQQPLFNSEELESFLGDFPLPCCNIGFSVAEAEERDWNEQWEQEGFEPWSLPLRKGRLLVHDGRHLPETIGEGDISIEIDARMAFGTGVHETTRMMVGALTDIDPEGIKVLDCGTGTGILSIAALKLGAAEAVGYDIDEWSVDNARHNAIINRVDERFSVMLGDASVLESMEGTFDVVMANINRNILLADMPAFVRRMAPHSTLLLSGFYSADVQLLKEKAEALGLGIVGKKEDNDWACLMLRAQAANCRHS